MNSSQVSVDWAALAQINQDFFLSDLALVKMEYSRESQIPTGTLQTNQSSFQHLNQQIVYMSPTWYLWWACVPIDVQDKKKRRPIHHKMWIFGVCSMVVEGYWFSFSCIEFYKLFLSFLNIWAWSVENWAASLWSSRFLDLHLYTIVSYA